MRPQPAASMSGSAAWTHVKVPVSDDPVPLLGCDVGDRVEGLDAGAGDQDLDGSEIAADLGERSVDRCAVCDVYLDSDRLGAPGPQLAGRGICCSTVAIEDGDKVAVAAELGGDPQTDA